MGMEEADMDMVRNNIFIVCPCDPPCDPDTHFRCPINEFH